jgi:acyl carrier protein
MTHDEHAPLRWMRWLFPRSFGPRRVPAGLGRWGRYTFLEPHVRRLAAEHLGVEGARLACGASLRDTLEASGDSLQRLATALEHEFDIVVSMDVLDAVHSYGDLVHATGTLVHGRERAA